jgi:hypothetical protein
MRPRRHLTWLRWFVNWGPVLGVHSDNWGPVLGVHSDNNNNFEVLVKQMAMKNGGYVGQT